MFNLVLGIEKFQPDPEGKPDVYHFRVKLNQGHTLPDVSGPDLLSYLRFQRRVLTQTGQLFELPEIAQMQESPRPHASRQKGAWTAHVSSWLLVAESCRWCARAGSAQSGAG